MKVTELEGLLSDQVKKEIGLVQLKANEVVKFKINRQPTSRFNTAGDMVFIYPTTYLRKTDIVYLPVETENGEIITKEFELEYNPSDPTDLIVFEPNMQAEIRITGKDPNKKELLWFLRLSNYNSSNPYKLPSKVALFSELEPEQEAKTSIEKEVEIATMVHAITSMSIQEVDAAYGAVGLAGHDNPIEKQKALIVYIKSDKNRTIFNRLVLRKLDVVSELVKRALENSIIVYNDDTRTFARTIFNSNGQAKNVANLYTAPVGRIAEEEFAKWLSAKENVAEYNKIDKAVNVSKKQAATV